MRPISCRGLALFGCAVALLAVSSLVYWLWPRPGITYRNISSIHFGMTERQVEHILGATAGDYSNPKRDVGNLFRQSRLQALPAGYVRKVWLNDAVGIALVFNSDGVVCRDPGEIARYIFQSSAWDQIWDRIPRLSQLVDFRLPWPRQKK
jgi:hypothetical protein